MKILNGILKRDYKWGFLFGDSEMGILNGGFKWGY